MITKQLVDRVTLAKHTYVYRIILITPRSYRIDMPGQSVSRGPRKHVFADELDGGHETSARARNWYAIQLEDLRVTFHVRPELIET